MVFPSLRSVEHMLRMRSSRHLHFGFWLHVEGNQIAGIVGLQRNTRRHVGSCVELERTCTWLKTTPANWGIGGWNY